MNKFVVSENLEAVFAHTLLRPTTVMWNRLEGRPRTQDFTRALKAEVRDPLWLVTRQWQMGEFAGEDAGSPIAAQLAFRTDRVSALHAGGESRPYDVEACPLEAEIEARPLPLARAGRAHLVDVRLALGRRFEQLLDAAGHAALRASFRAAYPFHAPTSAESDYAVTAHAAAWQTLSAVAGRALDGGALWLHLESDAVNRASDGLGLAEPEKAAIDSLGEAFREWARSRYVQPVAAWRPRHLEYAAELEVSRSGRAAALGAPEYRGGHLDWFHFDAVAPGAHAVASEAPALQVNSFVPTSIQFEGMPNTRHWAFEEGATNFGDIRPDTTDLAKLLLVEFGLTFANDWFLLPLELRVGSLTEIHALVVDNVFGERFLVEPAVSETTPTSSWQMFRLTNKGARDSRLFLPPSAPTGLQSAPIEAVAFVRDEVSNRVWAIETAVQLADGSSRRGRELAQELHAKYQSAIVATPAPGPSNGATAKYTLMRSVPEHWVPFVPVQVRGENREIQLQRAAMPRLLEGQAGVLPSKVAPRTTLVREGLDDPAPRAYYLAEEEVERAGTIVETRFQRCRWINGRVVTWLAHQRKTGRGEVASGLAFDVLVPTRPDST